MTWLSRVHLVAAALAAAWILRPHARSLTDVVLGAVAASAVVGGTTVAHRARRVAAAAGRAGQHDPLTGLANRLLLASTTEEALLRRREHGGRVMMFLIDLDRFKLLNDTHGHLAGDQLLSGLADRLLSGMPDCATVCRLGGDEFAVVIDDVDTAWDPMDIARLIAMSWEQPIELDRGPVRTSGSIGVAVATDHDDPTSLLRNADAAMYRAKADGRSGIAVYDEHQRADLERRLDLEQALFDALANGEMTVVFQPIVDLGTGLVHAAEALLRWQHPRLGIVSPTEFIPLAEDSGMIDALGLWVLDEALGQLAVWRAGGVVRSDFTVHVNVSGAQLHGDFADEVADVLDLHAMEPSALMIELTESVLMRAGAEGTDVLEAIDDLGVPLALDDFGTGFSSLSYLHQAKVHTVKIDRSFVGGMTKDPTRLAIVAAVVSLTRSLGLQVIAEGVDTDEQVDLLAAMGCHLAQGFLMSQPLLAPGMVDYLGASRSGVRGTR